MNKGYACCKCCEDFWALSIQECRENSHTVLCPKCHTSDMVVGLEQWQEAIGKIQGLNEFRDDKSPHNPEYLRGQVELLADLMPKSYFGMDELVSAIYEKLGVDEKWR